MEVDDLLARARDSKDTDEAIALYERVLVLAPDTPEALVNLGRIRSKTGDLAMAERLLRRAVEIEAHPAAFLNLGVVYVRQGNDAPAATCFMRALELSPGFIHAHFNLAGIHERAGRLDDALRHYDAILAVEPQNAAAGMAKAQYRFTAGDLREGWTLYQRRHAIFWGAGRQLPGRRWRGEDISGQTLLLTVEQGLGEQIMFASMVPEIVGQARHVIIECEPRLVPLFQRSFPATEVVPWQNPWHPRVSAADIAWHAALGDPGEWRRAGFEDFPPHPGYLAPDADKATDLRARYRALAKGRPVVGVSWQSAAKPLGPHKSIPPAILAPLWGLDVFWVNLQYGPARGDPAVAPHVHTDADVMPTDIDAAAAQIAAMDKVVTVSNTAAHLAGALAKPTLVLTPKAVGQPWYWFPTRVANPWYPSVRIITQTKDGDWRDVVAAAAAQVKP